MGDCCTGTECALDGTQARQRSTLKIVLVLNAVMFAALAGAALYAGSTSLLSDSLDDLGDALTYALSLWAVSKSTHTKARIALFKGLLILAAALVVVSQIIAKLLHPETPHFGIMLGFATFGLIGNGICLALLNRHRSDDINMSSVWECSRNDMVNNLAVILAGVGVWLADAQWPDIVIAVLLVAFLLRSASRVVIGAWHTLRHHH